MTDFSLAISPRCISSCPAPTSRWVPPPIGFLKLNIDSEVSSCSKGGIGGLLRDEKGSILFQFSEAVRNDPPVWVEFEALYHGLSLFLSSWWANKSRLIIEFDCKQLIDWCLGKGVPPFPIRSRVQEVVERLCSEVLCVRWVPRLCNIDAD
ncbi:hypothetical protein V6N13_098910 [Hibiscus sabdariffa]|uniref:RNase H type-1 domain-containing protein n=1 Tax=Hibiscus sabdariffa TaxID=183260 RepID=A0ABR2EFB1_9ROSI